MLSDPLPPSSPWRLELVVVRGGSHDSSDRRSLSRDVERGLLLRLRRGVHVDRTAFLTLSPEDQHVVRMRALAAASDGPVVFSHFSAAVLHGLPVLWSRLATVHTTVDERARRGQEGVTGHLFAVRKEEVHSVGSLLVTSVGRTVVDIAGAAPFEEGVMAADGALVLGVRREVLLAAADLAGPRRAGNRIAGVAEFAHPGAESAAESRSRCTMVRIGVEPPELQHPVVLDDGSQKWLDFFFRSVRAGGEVDGAKKYLDPELAKQGAGLAVYEEKLREDALRAQLNGLARWGWTQAGSPSLLAGVLSRIHVRPCRPRATITDYAAEASTAVPRLVPRRPLVQR